MIYIIFPEDESTEFLFKICANFEAVHGKDAYTLINVTADMDSYAKIIQLVQDLPDKAFILFLGHGHSERLYGVYTWSEEALFDINKMYVFDNKNILAVACHSATIFKHSYNRFSISSSIGFGSLPTDIVELEDKKFSDLGIEEKHLEQFKDVIVDVVSKSIIKNYKEEEGIVDSYYLFSYLKLLLNRRIAEAVLDHKNRELAELIYQVRMELSYIQKLD